MRSALLTLALSLASASSDVCGPSEYYSPNTRACVPKKGLGEYCNSVQLCNDQCVHGTCSRFVGEGIKLDTDGQCKLEDTSQGQLSGAELMEPIVYRSRGGELHVDLVLDVHPYHDTHYVCPMGMRMFNGRVPGPTMVVKPGDKLVVHFTNRLAPDEPNQPQTNQFRDLNTTNLHTHGLHISAKEPFDNVMVEIEGGGSFEYTYMIPVDHMPGHHWYHPHHHGSTSLQTVTSFGSIIVEPLDAPESPGFGLLPAPLTSMREVLLATGSPGLNRDASGVTLNSIFEETGNDEWMCTNTTDEDPTKDTYRMVNFQYQPYIRLFRREPVLLRWLNSDWTISLNMTIQNVEGTPDCSLLLLAKDGIPLHDAPRSIGMMLMMQAARADVVVVCEGEGVAEFVDRSDAVGSSTVLRLHVNHHITQSRPATKESVAALSPLPVVWPFYLQSLLDQTPTVKTWLQYMVLYGGPEPKNLDDQPWLRNKTVDPGVFFTVNEMLFDHDRALWEVPYGEVVEVEMRNTIKNGLAHPHHQHIYPFQVTTMPPDIEQTYGNYVQIGDWHDVLGLADPVVLQGKATYFNETTNWTMRWRAVDFPDERMIFHCHILDHEDMGMMSFFHISHTNGTFHHVDGNFAQDPSNFV